MALNKSTAYYDFAGDVDLIIDGLPITGAAEDGGVEFEFSSEIVEHVSGADGHVAISRQNDYRMIATITVMEGSLGYTYLSELVQKQKQTRVNPYGPMPFAMRDNRNEDEVTSDETIFLNWPTPNKSRNASEREFQVLLPHAASTFKPAGAGSYSLG